jgi:membrane protein implicated in regulation of membrane protease activity
MPDWVWWLIAAGVLGLAELHSLTLVLGMLAIAAVPAALTGVAGAPATLQVLTFAIASALLLLVIRPIAARHRRTPLALRTGTAALVGKRGTAVSAVDASQGLVRIGGEVWTARTYDDSVVVPAGASVDVVEIDGATAVVLPVSPVTPQAVPKEHP